MPRITMLFLLASLFSATTLPTTADGVELPKKGANGYPPELPKATAEVYKQVGDVKLQLYVHRPPQSKAGDANEKATAVGRPAIIFFFGGGWNGGSPGQFRYQCEYLASRGMIAVTADYRVASRQGVKAIDCVRDAADAVRYLRTNAAKFGLDPNKIVAAGGSAGGHLAACLGTLPEIPTAAGTQSDVSYCPNAMLLFNPALDLSDGKTGLALTSERTGVDPLVISPLAHVSKQTPPTLLLFGSEDKMVEAARAFSEKLQQLDGRCELEVYPGQAHGFFNVGRDENRPFLATLERADRFLESLGYVTGSPQVANFFK
jgi:acetyl esterase